MNEPGATQSERRGGALLRRAASAARLGVSVAALALLFRRVDVRELPRALEDAGLGTMVLAFTLYLGSQAVSAIRWTLIARSAGFDIRPWRAVRYYFIGMFFNTLGPSTLGGDFARTLYLKPHGVGHAVAAATVLLDRVIGFVWLSVIAALALLVVESPPLPSALWWGAELLAATLVLLCSLSVAFAGLRTPAPADVYRTTDSLRALCRDRAMLVQASILSIAVQSIQIGAAATLASALTPSVHWNACFVFQPLVAMLGGLPISASGLGIRESGYVYFLSTLAGAPIERSAAFALAWLAMVLAGSLTGALVFLVASDNPRPRTG